jgi:heme/copper-type cytochrome/quinol oxidase subunit 2
MTAAPAHPAASRLAAGLLPRWILLGALGLLVMLVPPPRVQAAPAERSFRVLASSYQFTPAVLFANPGDRITIDLVATDYVHGLSVDGYGVEVTADPGQTARLTFTAGQAGLFRLRCSVACGPMHPFMVGKLQVGPNWLYYRGMALGVLALAGTVWMAARPTSARKAIDDES